MRSIVKNATIFIRSMPFWGTQLVSYPVLYQIKQWWPDCKVTVVGNDPLHKHYESLPWVEEYVNAKGWVEMLMTISPDTDLLMSLHPQSEKHGFLALIKRPALKLGFKNYRLTDFAWTHSHKKDRSEYIALSNLSILKSFRSFDPEKAARGCLKDLAALDLKELPSDLILMLPGGGDGPYKRWPIQSFLELYRLLKQRQHSFCRFGFVLGPDEKEESALLKQSSLPDVLIYENCSVSELARLMLGARLIVANDCGPSHLAQFACVPYVCVLHEPNPEWYWQRPYSRFVIPHDGSTDIKHVRVEDVANACHEAVTVGTLT